MTHRTPHRACLLLLAFTCLSLALTPAASAQDTSSAEIDTSAFQLTEIVSGIDWILDIVDAHDGSGRLFLVSQVGLIWIYKDGHLLDDPFLDVSSLLDREFNNPSTEIGLHGLVFDPGYQQNGKFYITYETYGPTTSLARYTVSADDPDKADPDSRETLIAAHKQFRSHTMAQLVFGPDGYLYVGVGDGGTDSFGDPDPFGAGQRTDEIFASILRIDVHAETHPYGIPPDNPFADTDSHAKEVWVYGLRNPSRFSFDRETGDLYIGDVGHDLWEEIDIVPAGSSGQNFGWSSYEGPEHTIATGRSAFSLMSPLLEPTGTVVWPALTYPHQDSNCAVIGGFVYRGEQLPALRGTYLYGDLCSGRIWGASRNEQGFLQERGLLFDTDYMIAAFGEDAQGELYVANYGSGGSILQLTTA
jgi:glucose/arabinose dehydrogenase